jgi:hypothetical protein
VTVVVCLLFGLLLRYIRLLFDVVHYVVTITHLLLMCVVVVVVVIVIIAMHLLTVGIC